MMENPSHGLGGEEKLIKRGGGRGEQKEKRGE